MRSYELGIQARQVGATFLADEAIGYVGPAIRREAEQLDGIGLTA